MLLRGKYPKFKKESGVLLPLSSLPSDYGIGSLGEEAYRFASFLRNANQTYWQLLPLVPVGKGNSPYSSASAFAGEILYIDIEELIKDGFLNPEDIEEKHFPKNTDYTAARKFKLPLLKKAADNFDVTDTEFISFKKENAHWLYDFALYMAIKDSYSGNNFLAWEDGLKYRSPEALNDFHETHQTEILFYEITQFLFYRQFFK